MHMHEGRSKARQNKITSQERNYGEPGEGGSLFLCLLLLAPTRLFFIILQTTQTMAISLLLSMTDKQNKENSTNLSLSPLCVRLTLALTLGVLSTIL